MVVRAVRPSIQDCHDLYEYDPITGDFTHKVKKMSRRHLKSKRDGTPAGWVQKVTGGRKYKALKVNDKTIYAHDVAWAMSYGYWPETVDHADGDGTNNILDNLRIATFSQNGANSKMQERNKYGCKGIYYYKHMKKFKVKIVKNRVSHMFGPFVNLQDAIDCSNRERARLHGDFARS